ncbi:MAG: PQQ-binding-like beta-propeller repeat protein [Bacteroidales bacterium]
MTKWVRHIIVAAVALTGALLLGWWLLFDPARSIQASLPGADNRPPRTDTDREIIHIGEYFYAPGGHITPLKESWPRFRGAGFDNISNTKFPLIDRFNGRIPPVVWQKELGEGHAGAAIYQGEVYVLDYDETLRADLLRCFNLADGSEVWQRGYRLTIRRNHGMSRTVPAVTEKYVVTLGPRGHVMCVDRATGDFRWGYDTEQEHSPEIPFWYTGQCPLVDQDLAIIATGGKTFIVAIDCATGQRVWATPNPGNWKMSHSSIMPMTFGGRKMYVYSAVGGVIGIAADGPDAGRTLWTTTAWNKSVVAPSPVCLPDGRIFLSAGYGAGSMMIRLIPNDNRFDVEVLDQYGPAEGLASEQQTPLYFNGHLIGIQPKDAGALRNQLICVNPSNLRNPVWTSDKGSRFGLGPYLIADNKLFILSDDGTMTIVKPDINSYVQLDQIKLFDGQDAWAPIAVADGYMVLRDSKYMVCLRMGGRE